MQIFKRHLKYSRVGDKTIVDASAINDMQCFHEWAITRQCATDLEKTFQRCLTAHVTGSGALLCKRALHRANGYIPTGQVRFA